MTTWQTLSVAGQMIAVVALVLAALHDVAVRTVPNRLVAVVCAGASLEALAAERAVDGLAVAALVFLASFLLWLRGWMGGGDVKLLAASVPLVEPSAVFDLVLAVSLAGGLLALPYLPGRRLFPPKPSGRPEALIARLVRCERWRLSRRGPLPYAVAIAAGVILVLCREG